MSLGNEIFEWRKQMVEKLLLNGVKPEDLEKQVNDAERLIFGDYDVEVCISIPLKHASELKAILLDFVKKNGCIISTELQG